MSNGDNMNRYKAELKRFRQNIGKIDIEYFNKHDVVGTVCAIKPIDCESVNESLSKIGHTSNSFRAKVLERMILSQDANRFIGNTPYNLIVSKNYIYVLSSDNKYSIAKIKYTYIGMIEVLNKFSSRFIWGDHTPAKDARSNALKDFKSKLTEPEIDIYKNILTPVVLTLKDKSFEFIFGFFIERMKFSSMIRMDSSPTTTDIYVFNMEDIEWDIEPRMNISDEGIDKALNYINNGVSFEPDHQLSTLKQINKGSDQSGYIKIAVKPNACNKCSNTPPKLYSCAGCKLVKYCNAKCQNDDWKSHKMICKYTKALKGIDDLERDRFLKHEIKRITQEIKKVDKIIEDVYN